MSVHAEKYRPSWAPHVDGSYTRRVVDEDGLPEEQRVHARCEKCGAEFRTTCQSGQVRLHVAKFARVHLHADPLASPRPGVDMIAGAPSDGQGVVQSVVRAVADLRARGVSPTYGDWFACRVEKKDWDADPMTRLTSKAWPNGTKSPPSDLAFVGSIAGILFFVARGGVGE